MGIEPKNMPVGVVEVPTFNGLRQAVFSRVNHV